MTTNMNIGELVFNENKQMCMFYSSTNISDVVWTDDGCAVNYDIDKGPQGGIPEFFTPKVMLLVAIDTSKQTYDSTKSCLALVISDVAVGWAFVPRDTVITGNRDGTTAP